MSTIEDMEDRRSIAQLVARIAELEREVANLKGEAKQDPYVQSVGRHDRTGAPNPMLVFTDELQPAWRFRVMCMSPELMREQLIDIGAKVAGYIEDETRNGFPRELSRKVEIAVGRLKSIDRALDEMRAPKFFDNSGKEMTPAERLRRWNKERNPWQKTREEFHTMVLEARDQCERATRRAERAESLLRDLRRRFERAMNAIGKVVNS